MQLATRAASNKSERFHLQAAAWLAPAPAQTPIARHAGGPAKTSKTQYRLPVAGSSTRLAGDVPQASREEQARSSRSLGTKRCL